MEINNCNKKLKEYLRRIRNENYELSTKVIELEQKIHLIKLRDSIKDIIDLFSKVLSVSKEETYAFKSNEIKQKIKGQNQTKIIKKEFSEFIGKIYDQFLVANKDAHSLALDEPILTQLFLRIDPSDDLGGIRLSLEKGNLNNLLEDLSINRKNNYFNEHLFYQKIHETFDKVKNLKDLLTNDN